MDLLISPIAFCQVVMAFSEYKNFIDLADAILNILAKSQIKIFILVTSLDAAKADELAS